VGRSWRRAGRPIQAIQAGERADGPQPLVAVLSERGRHRGLDATLLDHVRVDHGRTRRGRLQVVGGHGQGVAAAGLTGHGPEHGGQEVAAVGPAPDAPTVAEMRGPAPAFDPHRGVLVELVQRGRRREFIHRTDATPGEFHHATVYTVTYATDELPG